MRGTPFTVKERFPASVNAIRIRIRSSLLTSLGYEFTWIRFHLGTCCIGEEFTWGRVDLGAACKGSEVTWLPYDPNSSNGSTCATVNSYRLFNERCSADLEEMFVARYFPFWEGGLTKPSFEQHRMIKNWLDYWLFTVNGFPLISKHLINKTNLIN